MNATYEQPYLMIATLITLIGFADAADAQDARRWSFFRRSPDRVVAELIEAERIETERHDFTQSTTTLGRGAMQFESGYSFFQKSDNGEAEQSHTAPETMFRLGLTDNFEFRLRYNEVWLFGDAHDRKGAEDLRFSFKRRLSDQHGWVPESAVVLSFTAPTGNRDWSTTKVDSGIDYIYGWQLTEAIELYGSTGAMQNALGDFAFRPSDPAEEDFLLYSQSIALGIETTEASTMYLEFFGLFTDGFEEEEESPVFFNVGIDYYISNDFVIDFRVGNGLNADADDFFCGIGGGVRF